MEKLGIKLELEDRWFERALSRGLMETGRVNLIRDGGSVGILLSDRVFDGDDKGVRLMDEEVAWDGEPPLSVYKYTPASEMVSLLRYATGKGKYRTKKRASLIAAVAEDGGVGTSTIAVNLARTIGRSGGGKALYVNLCPISTSPMEVLWGERDMNGGKHWIRLLLGLKKKREGCLEGALNTIEELSYIPVPRFNRHGDDLDNEMTEMLLEEAGSLGFSHLICDMGNHLEGRRMELLKIADRVIAVNGSYEMERSIGDRGISVSNLYSDRVYELETDNDSHVRFGYCGGMTGREMDMAMFDGLMRIVEMLKEDEL